MNWKEHFYVEHAQWLTLYRDLLTLRQERIVPLLGLIQPGAATWQVQGGSVLTVDWPLTDSTVLRMIATLGPEPFPVDTGPKDDSGSLNTIYVSRFAQQKEKGMELEGWGVSWIVGSEAQAS